MKSLANKSRKKDDGRLKFCNPVALFPLLLSLNLNQKLRATNNEGLRKSKQKKTVMLTVSRHFIQIHFSFWRVQTYERGDRAAFSGKIFLSHNKWVKSPKEKVAPSHAHLSADGNRNASDRRAVGILCRRRLNQRSERNARLMNHDLATVRDLSRLLPWTKIKGQSARLFSDQISFLATREEARYDVCLGQCSKKKTEDAEFERFQPSVFLFYIDPRAKRGRGNAFNWCHWKEINSITHKRDVMLLNLHNHNFKKKKKKQLKPC